jgi:uracil-DNA glycosylase
VIRILSEKREHLVFMLWGSYAQQKGVLINHAKHLVLRSVHPSPLSAYRGFIGCGHFSEANEFLISKEKTPIQW